jgi:hypothetical protein
MADAAGGGNGNDAAQPQEIAVPQGGYRLWGLILEVSFRGAALFSKLILQLESTRTIRQGVLICVTRHCVVEYAQLPSYPGLPLVRYVRGRAAAEIILHEIAQNNVIGPIGEDDGGFR